MESDGEHQYQDPIFDPNYNLFEIHNSQNKNGQHEIRHQEKAYSEHLSRNFDYNHTEPNKSRLGEQLGNYNFDFYQFDKDYSCQEIYEGSLSAFKKKQRNQFETYIDKSCFKIKLCDEKCVDSKLDGEEVTPFSSDLQINSTYLKDYSKVIPHTDTNLVQFVRSNNKDCANESSKEEIYDATESCKTFNHLAKNNRDFGTSKEIEDDSIQEMITSTIEQKSDEI